METEEARWLKMRDLFARATDLPTGQRLSFVENSSSDDPVLRDELVALLHADQCQKKKPITGAIEATLEADIEARRQRLVGSVVGAYRLISVLGHGGTGTVYLAERLDAAGHSKVAIKIVAGAAISDIARRRFKDERQILANLSHPNIARLFDAGDTTEGYPYLVMDYIEGEPIDRYCNRHRLTLRQRIELILKVCDAVEYAHRNLIIHRDLKPANILVTKDGIPKLLDFGTAKLLAAKDEPPEFAVTRFQDQLLTLGYASPEQVLGTNISTASDVYTLGVILHELLTGIKLFDHASSYLELEKQMLTQESRRPSDVVNALMIATTNDSVSLQRAQRIGALRNLSSLQKLALLLKGDLDAITLRAIQTRLVDRYNSVEELSNDLNNYLNCKPVAAANQSTRYLLIRFIARHWLGIMFATLSVAAVLAMLGVLSLQARDLVNERDDARKEKLAADSTSAFMVDVFDNNDRAGSTARDLLLKASDRIHADPIEDPAVRARLLFAIGYQQRRYGFPETGIRLMEESLQIIQKTRNPPADLGDEYLKLALAQQHYGSHQRSREILNLARPILCADNGRRNLAACGQISLEHAQLDLDDGRPDLALPEIEQSLLALKQTNALEALGDALVTRSDILSLLDKTDRAKKDSLAAENLYAANEGKFEIDRAINRDRIAEDLIDEHDLDGASKRLEKSLISFKRIFLPSSIVITSVLNDLVRLRRAQQRTAEAETYAREVLKLTIRNVGEQHKLTAYSLTTLGIVLWLESRPTEAEAELQKALSIYKKILPEHSLYTAATKHYLAEVLLSEGKINQAVLQARSTFWDLQQAHISEWRIARTENVLGAALFAQHKLAEAQPLLEHSYEVLSTKLGPDLDTVQLARERLTHFYKSTHQVAKLAALNSAAIARVSAKK